MTEKSLENIPFDCKLEIMRRLNTGLDLVNLAKCSRGFNQVISQELTMWKNLCNFHFQQAQINALVNRSSTSSIQLMNTAAQINEVDWKSMYFKLKKRYGHREVYADMIQQCFHCKCLFWKVSYSYIFFLDNRIKLLILKEIGHPCVIKASFSEYTELDVKVEPVTPKKLIELLQL